MICDAVLQKAGKNQVVFMEAMQHAVNPPSQGRDWNSDRSPSNASFRSTAIGACRLP